MFQVQEQEEGLHQVQQEVAGGDRKETVGQGFCYDEEILFSHQGYCSLPGGPVLLHTSATQFRVTNYIKRIPVTLHHNHLKLKAQAIFHCCFLSCQSFSIG